jgi:hypothetical protein
MNQSTFKRLTSNLTQHFDDCDCVDLRASDILQIYGWRHDGFKLQIEYFDGLPTEHQKDVMQALINNAVSVLDDYFKEPSRTECHFCGEYSEDEFCSKECRKAYLSEN